MKTKSKDETICQFALRILKPIPKNQWIINEFTNKINKCCAIGHFKRLTSSNPKDYSDSNCYDWGDSYTADTAKLRKATQKFIKESVNLNFRDISSVNNSHLNGYKEPEIKDRVIHLLKDAVNAGF
jgi:hypothetical protein